MLTSSEVAERWKSTFGDFAPIGYVCREHLSARWLRIHSLPDSKRYPATEAECRELLRRHNEVATAVLGEGEECVLFVTIFAKQRTGPDTGELPDIDDAHFFSVPGLSTNGPTEQTWTNVAAAAVCWRRGRFDSLIQSVADENSAPVLIANFARHAAYAPYDGGADLFVDRPADVALLKKKWSSWLSLRVDGL